MLRYAEWFALALFWRQGRFFIDHSRSFGEDRRYGFPCFQVEQRLGGAAVQMILARISRHKRHPFFQEKNPKKYLFCAAGITASNRQIQCCDNLQQVERVASLNAPAYTLVKANNPGKPYPAQRSVSAQSDVEYWSRVAGNREYFHFRRKGHVMSKVIAITSIALDGYVADRNDGVGKVFHWYLSGDIEIPIQGSNPMTFRSM